jgi:hypothetical protein
MEEGHFAPSHHMFTAPKPEHIPLLDSDPAAVLSEQYDLVCNGFEVAGGSIRIHDQTLQAKIMQLIGFSMEQAREQFGHMLEAFEYGAPPARRHRPRHRPAGGVDGRRAEHPRGDGLPQDGPGHRPDGRRPFLCPAAPVR